MKIGLFIDGSFLPSREGATQRIYQLAKYLPKLGIDIVVFHCYRGWSDIELIQQEDFTTYLLSPEIYYSDADFLSNIVLQEKIDIIQICDPPLILSQGLKIKQKTSVVLIWEIHEIVSSLAEQLGNINKNRHLELLEYYSSLCCDFIICFTEEDKFALAEMGISLNKIEVFPCGIDLSSKKYRDPNLSSHTILFLGNMFYEPNYRGVLSIAKDIYPSVNKIRKDVKFKMVGTFPEELEKNFANENFIFTGWVENLNQIFKETSIAIAPIKECSGMRIKILDYMAAGLPIVSTSNAAVGIKHDNSILIENNTVKFANKIVYLLDSPKESQEIAHKARKQIEKYYNWNNIIIDIKNFYSKVKDYRSNDFPTSILKKINQFELPLPSWLEETLSKERFVKTNYKIIKHPAIIKNHKISIL